MFKKLGLAITFSPTGKALLKETVRLQKLFNSQLVLIHIGKKNSIIEAKLLRNIEEAGVKKSNYEIIWSEGDPAAAIIKNAKNAKVDLLVAGALEREKLLKLYFSSVARKIMREFTSSCLILKSPSEEPKGFKKFYISADYSPQSEKTIQSAYYFALKEKTEEFVIVRDFHAPGLTASIIDGESPEEIKITKEKWINEEKEKMTLFVNELNLKGLKTKIVCIYGREGWEAGNFARLKNADIFAVPGPTKKMGFIDRLFPHDIEYSFEKLPSNLLIIR